jgi:hypothetical protein
MGPAEVAMRARRAIDARVDDATWTYARPLWRRRWSPPKLAHIAPDLTRPHGFLDDANAGAAQRVRPELAAQVQARADDLLAGRRQLLGYPPVDLASPVDWTRDPQTGRTWPDRHGKRLDYRRSEVGDPKVAWELNRCQELPLLVLAWRLTGERRYAEHAAEQLLAWLRASAPGRGIAWSNGFEPGLRAISFALVFDALRGSGLLDASAARLVVAGLWQHARFIEGDLSPASSANNHLVGELAGLAVVGLLMPEVPDAERFLRSGLEGLAREADRQILEDGGGAEQAYAYHLFVLDLLLLVAALCERRGVAPPPALDAALTRASSALTLQVDGDEPEPTYGDADDGRAFILDAEDARTTRAVMASIDARAGRATTDPVAVLLFGERDGAVEARTHAASGSLPATGLVVLRRGSSRLVMDVGPLGYLSIAAHGHADALQVTLSDGNAELVVDPGTGSYYGNPRFRESFRGTAVHATVTVDGADQAEQAGPFMWRRHYRCTLHRADVDAGVVVAEHDGYLRLPDPVRHRRVLAALDDGMLLVYDELESADAHRFVQTWPLDPVLEADLEEGIVEARSDGVTKLLLATASTHAGHVELSRSWVSRRLEEVVPAWSVRHEVEGRGRVGVAALLLLAQHVARGVPQLSLERIDDRVLVSIDHGGARRELEVDVDAAAVTAREVVS